MVKVWPKNDHMRKILTHPLGQIGFHEEGPIDWPDDSFTARRVADGDITLEEPEKPQEAGAPAEAAPQSEEPAPDVGKV